MTERIPLLQERERRLAVRMEKALAKPLEKIDRTSRAGLATVHNHKALVEYAHRRYTGTIDKGIEGIRPDLPIEIVLEGYGDDLIAILEKYGDLVTAELNRLSR